MIRNASAVWNGSLKEGNGTITTPSGVLAAQPYSFKLRFVDEDGRAGTNPEELIAAAHASCFSMAFSGQLTKAGYTADEIRTNATLTMEQTEAGFTITKIHLDMTAKVPGIAADEFQTLAGNAKAGCPVSRVLNAEITMTAALG